MDCSPTGNIFVHFWIECHTPQRARVGVGLGPTDDGVEVIEELAYIIFGIPDGSRNTGDVNDSDRVALQLSVIDDGVLVLGWSERCVTKIDETVVVLPRLWLDVIVDDDDVPDSTTAFPLKGAYCTQVFPRSKTSFTRTPECRGISVSSVIMVPC